MALLVGLTGNPLVGVVSLVLGGFAVLIVRQAGLRARLRDKMLAEQAALQAEWIDRPEPPGPQPGGERTTAAALAEADSSS